MSGSNEFQEQNEQVGETKIGILLTEYSALRDEVLQRAMTHTQILTVAGASVVGIITIMYAYSFTLGCYLLVFLMLLSIFLFKLIEFDVLHASRRLKEIEAEINTRSGERLLVWETDYGLKKVGYGVRYWYALRSLLKFCSVVLLAAAIVVGGLTAADAFLHTHFVEHIAMTTGLKVAWP